MTEIQEIEIRKGVYAADLNISKEQWLELLQDNTIVGNSMPTLLRFYRAAEHKGTCKDVNPDSPYSENNLFWQFGRRVSSRLNLKVINADGKQNYWTIPAKEGKSLPNGFEWTLRDELVDAIRDWLILDLLKRYKDKFLNVALKGPYKDGEQADELYKWQLITKCSGKEESVVVNTFKEENVIDRAHDRVVLIDLLENHKQQMTEAFALLENNNVSLADRLSKFKETMAGLCDKKYNSKANDERTASAFLTCWNPREYTFYKDEIYQNYCSYIGEKTQKAGQKYPHYLQLLTPLVQAINQDKELTDKYVAETDGLIQSDLLIAQNILWQMKNLMETDNNRIECIIANITWNSNDWKGISDDKSGHKWVQEEGNIAHESWNFDFDNKRNPYDRIYGFAQFTKQPKNFKNKKYLVVFRSDNKIVGFYGNATICDYKEINSNESYNMIGDKSLSLLLENKIDDSSKDLLFGKERVGQIGFNHITTEDALQILNRAKVFNPSEGKIDKIKDWLTQNEGINQTTKNMIPMEIKQYTDILRLKKNIILQGAPGTGKTYNTAALALSICGVSDVDLNDHKLVMERYEQMSYDKDKNPDGQIGFCTFHQSMDYEDFVEGIKPQEPETENGQITYKVENGIFKIMCANAEKGNAIRTDNFKESWDKLVNYLDEKDFLSVDLLSGKGSFKVELNEYGTGLANRTYENGVFEKDNWIQGKSKFFNYDQLYNIYRGLPGTPAGGHDNYRKAIVAKMKKDFSLVEYSETQTDKHTKNYVLIIDEINRGNVSRIFGELITLLEKDKRLGSEHPIKVTLPYSKESFGVPENLYIIGTMNTTDRSVGNIDYAVRRRFAFATLQSKRDLVVAHSTEQAAVLFDTVKSFIEKNKTEMDFEDLMVGHSYFFAKNDEELALRWQYEILPLLNEYIKDDILRADRLESDMPIEKFVEKWSAKSDAKSETDE
jgi:hypothetical protein